MSTNDEKALHDKLANRQSLPVITTASHNHSKLRHTQSHNYGSKPKKKVKTIVPEPIPEDQPIPEKPLHRENRSDHEHIRLSIISEESERKFSRNSRKAGNAITKENHSYDNFAFEEGKDNGPSSASVSRTNSNANSVQSSRNPSVQSLTVIREQYCCCARRTPCERILVASVAVLATIIVILVIVISFIASSKKKGIEETFRWKL